MHFHRFILLDEENEFLKKVSHILSETFDKIKKSQDKRNTKFEKIVDIEKRLEGIDEEEDYENYKKYNDALKLLRDDIKDTEYVEDEDRIGEDLTFSRAFDTIIILLRFI